MPDWKLEQTRQCAKRALKPVTFDLDGLAEKNEQFSDAETEGAVKNAVLEAFIDGRSRRRN